MRRKRKKTSSFSHIVVIAPFCLMLLASTVLVIYISLLIREYRNDLITSGESTMNLYEETIMSRMKMAETTTMLLYTDQNAANILHFARTESEKYNIIYDIMSICNNNLSWQEDLVGYVLLYDQYQSRRYTFQSDRDFGLAQYIADDVMSRADYDTYYGWQSAEYHGKCYLYYTYAMFGISLTAVIDLPQQEDLENDMKLIYRFDGHMLGENRDSEEFVKYITAEGTVLRNDRLITTQKIGKSPLEAILVLPVSYTMVAQTSGKVIITGIIFTVLIGLLSYIVVRVRLIRPLNGMSETMVAVKKGDMDSSMATDTGVEEFNEIGSIFNQMMKEVQKLRIESYENTITKQKIESQFLRLQLEPHFMLNCLTSLYALSKQKKMEKLENRILTLSNYFRYELQDDYRFRLLEAELKFTEDAIEIRKDSLEIPIEMTLNMEENLKSLYVPAMIVETFIENSIKYADAKDKLLIQVQISKEQLEEQDYLHIIVCDNGKGYSDEWIQIIKEDNSKKAGSHIGLINLKRRLEFEYKEKAEFRIYNQAGAVNDIMIPIVKEENEY